MEVALNKKTFMRTVGDDVLFYNPISGASMVVEGASALSLRISKSFRPVEKIICEIAASYGVEENEARNDYLPLIESLLAEGLVVAKDEECEKSKEDVGKTSFEGGQKRNENIENSFSKFYRQRGLLLALHIDITSCCNERCVHCYLPGHETRFLDYDVIDKVLTDFRSMQGLTVYISGGECMTHPDFIRVLKRCRELDLNIIVLSNLTLCDSQMICALQKIKPQYINVSLYSMDPHEHDAITTVPGSWRQTMDAILACEKAGVNIRLAAPLLKINRFAFPKLKRFADAHRMYLVPDYSIIARADHSDENLQYACSIEELECTLKENRELFDMGWAGVCRDDPDAALCDIGVFRLHLNSYGDFYPCPSMYGYVLGNLREKTIMEIWACEKLKSLRRLKWKDMGKCITCEHRKFCEPCLAYNFNATGDMFKTIPQKCQTAKVIHHVYGE